MRAKLLFLFAIACSLSFSSTAYALSVYTVPQGGTGWGAFQSNTLLTGNGTTRLATTSIGSGLQLVGGVLSATGGAGSAGNWFTPTSYGNATNTTLGFLQGFTSPASSTIAGAFHLALSNGGLAING